MPIDYTKYPANWKKEIVPRILKRAGNRCELCSFENKSIVWSKTIICRNINGKYVKKAIWFSDINDAFRLRVDKKLPKRVKVVLTIAHLDHDEKNHNVDDSRLLALCQYCHLNYDANEKAKRRVKS